MPQASTGMATANTSESVPPLCHTMIMAKMNMMGALTQMRIIIWNDICTFCTSVVILVISDGVENLSISAKENDMTLAYSSCLMFLANPDEALDALQAPSMPNESESIAAATSMMLTRLTTSISVLLMPASTT